MFDNLGEHNFRYAKVKLIMNEQKKNIICNSHEIYLLENQDTYYRQYETCIIFHCQRSEKNYVISQSLLMSTKWNNYQLLNC